MMCSGRVSKLESTFQPPSASSDLPKNRKLCPEASANVFSRLLFLWLIPLVYNSFRSPLDDLHLWELRSFERAEATTEVLIGEWKQQNVNYLSQSIPGPVTSYHSRRLESAIFSAFVPQLRITGFLRLFEVILFVIQPIFLNEFIQFLQDQDDPVRNGYLWAVSLFLIPIMKIIIGAQYLFSSMRTGMRVRSALQGMLYKKCLVLSPSSRASSSFGEIVNVMHLDSQRIGDSLQLIHNLWSAPVQIIISVFLLYRYIGVSALVGFSLTILIIPLQSYLFDTQTKIRMATVELTDKRVKLLNEILQGIKVVKFYAWEKPFANLVSEHRDAEVKKHRSLVWVNSGLVTILFSFPIFIGVITFSFYSSVFNQPLDPAKIFTGIAILNQLRIPIMMLPVVGMSCINARIGIKRIERLLMSEDIDNYSREKLMDITNSLSIQEDKSVEESSTGSNQFSAQGAIYIHKGEFSWSKLNGSSFKVKMKDDEKKSRTLLSYFSGRKKKGCNKKEFKADEKDKKLVINNANQKSSFVYGYTADSTLQNINVEYTPGKLHAVVGAVGSGKSSLLYAILGEMRKVNGLVTLEGSVAHIGQTAWIFHDTLRNNIIFGKDFDQELYDTAIEVSGLRQDIEIFPDGDSTSIGERGVNLSGGQKQRISLARSVYEQADVYLFDDPLSALDAHVSQHVFRSCISNSGVLKEKLRILITNEVQLLPECDTVSFLENGTVLGQAPYDELRESNELFQNLVRDQELSREKEREQKVGNYNEGAKAPDGKVESSEMGKLKNQVPFKLGKSIMTDEERHTGSVGPKIYTEYFRKLTHPALLLVLLLVFLLSTALSIIIQYWLTYWSKETLTTENARSEAFFLGTFFALSVGYALSTYGRSICLLTLTLNASKKLHREMLASILHAPLTFFDTTPTGRILSRFSRNVSSLDEKLPQLLLQTMNAVMSLFLMYAFIGYLLPPFLAFAIPVMLLYIGLMLVFKRTTLELKRLDAISKSPIYAQFSETLSGLTTIRAYSKQDLFIKASYEKIDQNQRACFLWIGVNRLFTLVLEFGSSILIFATALFGVMSRGRQYAGAVGLALTYALQVTTFLGFTVRSATDLEGEMSCVERANYYANDLPQEASSVLKRSPAPKNWPERGEIEFENVTMRYRDGLPLALRGLSTSIHSGEKLGVVGRTGSGKSSLIVALLRMVELASGTIRIDGVDLHTLELDEIRSKLTIIPQDPFMFSGTIRLNIDPLGQFSDVQLWDALEKSHLKKFIASFEEGLDSLVSEYGENFSTGQRQMICLTRALLKRPKIFILDEASSSLDEQTDKLIQLTIRNYLGDATIITIAHRLLTLADYDRIMVLCNGEVVEMGSPAELLDKKGLFRNIVDSLGQSGAARFHSKVKR